MNPEAAAGTLGEGRAAERTAVDASFWRGKRVFVTGHTGFKGGWLCLWLQSLGCEVFGYAKSAPTIPNLYSVADVIAGMAGAVEGDIRDADRLRAALQDARPDIVVHLAAQTIVLRSYEDPIETFSTNVSGTVALLQAIRSLPCVRVVIAATSDKCYENREWPWGYRETDRLGGRDPYSASKAAAELAVAAMRSSFFNPATYATHRVGIASVRAGNVIGGGDWAPDRLVPDLMRALVAGRYCVIRNPASIRPWQHVLEPLSGYLRLAEALWQNGAEYAGGWNFGPLEDNAQPVAWIADRLGILWQGSPAWIPSSEPGRHENTYLKLDISKSRGLLHWSPVWSLETTLRSIVDWFAEYQAGARMRDVMAAQIAQFHHDAGKMLLAAEDTTAIHPLLGERHAPA